MIFRRTARALIIDERTSRLLLVTIEDPGAPFGYWHTLPGGALNRGETAEAAARREVEEEIGLQLDETSEWCSRWGLETFIFRKEPHVVLEKILLFMFHGTTDTPRTTSAEVANVFWADSTELVRLRASLVPKRLLRISKHHGIGCS